MVDLGVRECAKEFKKRGLGVQSFVSFLEDAGMDSVNGETVTQAQLDEWLGS